MGGDIRNTPSMSSWVVQGSLDLNDTSNSLLPDKTFVFPQERCYRCQYREHTSLPFRAVLIGWNTSVSHTQRKREKVSWIFECELLDSLALEAIHAVLPRHRKSFASIIKLNNNINNKKPPPEEVMLCLPPMCASSIGL